MQNQNEEPNEDNLSLDQHAELQKLNAEPGFSDTTPDLTPDPVPMPEPQNIVPIPIVAEKKSHVLRTIILSLVGLVVLSGIGFAMYYFVIRVPDAEYEEASAIIDVMIVDAKNLDDARSTLKQDTTTKASLTSTAKAAAKLVELQLEDIKPTLQRLGDAKGKASEYLDSQKKLEALGVMNKDESVKAVYSANKKVIDEYGTSSDKMYRTGYIFFTLLDYCIADMSIVPTKEMESLGQYDTQVKLCKDYLEQTKTVPSKEFNDDIYVPYKDVLLSYITSVRQLFRETPNSRGWNQAIANLEKIEQDVQKIDSSRIQSIKNSQNPKSQLEVIKAKINERQKLFFR